VGIVRIHSLFLGESDSIQTNLYFGNYLSRRNKDIIRFMGRAEGKSAWEEVFNIVALIPYGRVMNYGQIARLLQRPLSARAVGWAMHQCPPGLPWHRVVNASGGCSTDTLGSHPPGLQRAMLEAEDIPFRTNSTLDMEMYRWWPKSRRRKRK
jgi:methylated-DNA-protein-cysteine methyltransferase-like protein